MSFQLVPKLLTLNDLERHNDSYFALCHRNVTEFGSFQGALRKSGWRCRHRKVHVRYLISWWV